MTKSRPFTTADADRLLGLGDQLVFSKHLTLRYGRARPGVNPEILSFAGFPPSGVDLRSIRETKGPMRSIFADNLAGRRGRCRGVRFAGRYIGEFPWRGFAWVWVGLILKL